MSFIYQIVVPKNTAQSSTPLRVIPLPIRRIRRAVIQYPAGPKNNLGVRLTQQGQAFIPQVDSNVQYLLGDTNIYQFKFRADVSSPNSGPLRNDKPDAKTIDSSLNQIEVFAFNTDAANDWFITILFE